MMKINYIQLIVFSIYYFLMQAVFSHANQELLQVHQKTYRTYKEKFSNVLLIVNFNHPYYDNISFIRDLYSPAFENIVFYGEKINSEVCNVYTHTGYMLSEVVQDALTRFPECTGYLFLQDDCILHFWNYLLYDLDKIWFAVKFDDGNHQSDRFYGIRNVNGRCLGLAGGWGHWLTQWGFNAAWSARASFTQQDISFLQKNIGVDNIPCQMCEVFYIPSRLRDATLRLNICLKNVFCEIAIPTMLCCLDFIENWEKLIMLGGEGIGYGGINSPKLKNYPTHIDWIHPMKLSQKENRDGISQIFKQMTS